MDQGHLFDRWVERRRHQESRAAAALVAALERRGVRVWVDAGRVRYEPWQTLRASERAQVRQDAASIRAWLVTRSQHGMRRKERADASQ